MQLSSWQMVLSADSGISFPILYVQYVISTYKIVYTLPILYCLIYIGVRVPRRRGFIQNYTKFVYALWNPHIRMEVLHRTGPHIRPRVHFFNVGVQSQNIDTNVYFPIPLSQKMSSDPRVGENFLYMKNHHNV